MRTAVRAAVLLVSVAFVSGACTSPQNPGCHQCCRQHPTKCLRYSGDSVYNSWTDIQTEMCPADCAACAPCFDAELAIITESLQSLPEGCRCMKRISAAIDQCFDPDSCACKCLRIAQLQTQCALLVPQLRSDQ